LAYLFLAISAYSAANLLASLSAFSAASFSAYNLANLLASAASSLAFLRAISS